MRAQDFFKNPLTEWFFWLAKKIMLERRHPGLKLNYLAKAHACRFGRNNVVQERALLVECSLGDFSYVAQGCVLDQVSIGKFCSIGPNTRMGMGLHPIDAFVSTHPAFYSTRAQSGRSFADKDYFVEKAPIEIGHDVWIGANAIVKDGVRIGHGAVIAAGAVVTTDVPPYQIVGGAPAKPIRSRFEPSEVARLLEIAWWDKDEAWLRAHFLDFHDVQKFLR